MSTPTKDEFENVGTYTVGVTTITARGEYKGVAVRPGDRVWLTQEEQILTANAPRSDAANPLANGMLKLIAEGGNLLNRRPLRPSTEEEVATVVAQSEDAPEGTRPPTEEVATPVQAPAPKRAAAKA